MDNFASQTIADRKKRTETETDALRRVIIVRYLPRSKIQQITAWAGTDSNLALAMLLPAACVCQTDDKQFSWPASLAEIHSIMDILDTEGTDADVPAPAKKPRARKAAPLAEETQVLESSPVAAEAAEGTEAADAVPAKKPRAKKKVEG